MNFEDQIRNDLRDTRIPSALVPPAGLADSLLRGVRLRRIAHGLVGTVAVLVTLAVGVPAALSHARGGTAPPGPGAGPDSAAAVKPGTSTPCTTEVSDASGTGPQAIHLVTLEAADSYLLDAQTGRYRRLPYDATLSPDLTRVAVTNGMRTGIADRKALLRDGESAIDWLNLPPGNGPAWSPDGKALLFTAISKNQGVAFTAKRYDLATKAITDTPINVAMIGSAVGWAADSRSYVVLLRGKETNGTVEPGALQYVNPDGTLGRRVEIDGGLVGGAESYSPSRKYILTDPFGIMSEKPGTAKVVTVEAATSRVVVTLDASTRAVGWYNETTVVRVASCSPGPVLELVDIATGKVIKAVKFPELPNGPATPVGFYKLQLGSSSAFGEQARRLTF